MVLPDSKKKYICLFVFSLLVVFALTPVQGSAQPGIQVELSQDSVQKGDQIILRAGITGSGDQAVDVYFALLLPQDSALYYLGPDLQFTPVKVAILSGWKPFAIANVDLFSYTFTEDIVEGEYKWCGALTYAGKDLFEAGGILPGSVAVTPFTFLKSSAAYDPNAGIITWIPQDGDLFNTTEPEFFLQFSKPVNKESVKKNVEVTLKSLSSGKIVSVSSDENNEWWATAVLPALGTISQKINENEFILQSWVENDTKILFKIKSVTVYGQTFSLNQGASYEVTFQLKKGALFSDSLEIPEKTLGPIIFSIN